jgi:hypothetical protein
MVIYWPSIVRLENAGTSKEMYSGAIESRSGLPMKGIKRSKFNKVLKITIKRV